MNISIADSHTKMNWRFSASETSKNCCITHFISIIIFGLFLFPPDSLAQITYSGCRDIRGIAVADVPANVQDVAIAALASNGAPVIYFNPNVLNSFAPQTRLFWYGHECAHHALGHNFGTSHPRSREQEADCWGIRTLVENGYLDDEDVSVIQRDLSGLGPGDWTHLPGPRRALNLRECLDSGGRSSPNSCEYANDGECDEPDLCDKGTDRNDCRRRRDTRATQCVTNWGSCQMRVNMRRGDRCSCYMPTGRFDGIAQ